MKTTKTQQNQKQLNKGARLGTVTGYARGGACLVELGDGDEAVECDILQTAEKFPLCLVEGDSVLVISIENGPHLILGRIGPSRAGKNGAVAEDLVLDATKSLTLQCGEGSITLRGDGKVLIKGANLISKAEKMNRILGASVAVN